MLKFTVAELAKFKHTPLHVDETLDLKSELMARDPEILDVSPLAVTADVSADDGDFLLSAHIQGKLVVPSSRSLKPVTMPLDFDFSEIYIQDDANREKYEEGELVITMVDDELDVVAAVADHVLLSIPMQVLTPEEAAGEAMPSGQDWEVLSEDDYQATRAEEKTNESPFAQLQGLFADEADKKD